MSILFAKKLNVQRRKFIYLIGDRPIWNSQPQAQRSLNTLVHLTPSVYNIRPPTSSKYMQRHTTVAIITNHQTEEGWRPWTINLVEWSTVHLIHVFWRKICRLSRNCILSDGIFYYLRQVNEVNGGDNVFVRCVCVSVCLCAADRWELNANSSKTFKTTDFKFDTRVPRDSPDMTTKKISKRGRGQGHVTPNFWALNANSSKTVKPTDFKFDTLVPKDSPDTTPTIFLKGGVARVTWHPNFWALNANSSKNVKATDFKFDKRVPRDSSDLTPKSYPKQLTWRRYALSRALLVYYCKSVS